MCIELPAKLKHISRAHEQCERLAVKGMSVVGGTEGAKLQFTLQLSGRLGSALTRVPATLSGFGDRRLNKQRKTAGISEDRMEATFDAPAKMRAQELNGLATAVGAGRLAPAVESWLEKAPAPAASALVLELAPSEARVSVRGADGREAQLSAAEAEEARQQLWACLGEHLGLARRKAAAAMHNEGS